ncbi:unnamed protein product, partial [Prorocentrum cordatum]
MLQLTQLTLDLDRGLAHINIGFAEGGEHAGAAEHIVIDEFEAAVPLAKVILSLSKSCVRGCWRHQPTAKIYIQNGAAMLERGRLASREKALMGKGKGPAAPRPPSRPHARRGRGAGRMGGGEERAQVAGLWYVARRPLTPGPWPLLLFLHGAGERGPEDGTELELVQKYGPWQSQGVGCFFLLAPQCPSGVCWPGITDQLSALVRSICVRNDIDRSRCFATGISMGGFGVWALASKDPSLFKAIAPVCGGFTRPTTRDTGLASILQAARVPPKAEEIRELRKKQLRVWLFHGDADKIVSVNGSQGPFAELGGRARGEDHLRLTIYKDVGHNCWGKAYKTSELLEWLIQPAGQP